MAHADNKLEWCIKKAAKEGAGHRGIKVLTESNETQRSDKAAQHLAKADHNLKAMIHNMKGGFPDWAINASFYARYHCLLAILAKHGYESRNQECTFAAIEHLIDKKAVALEKAELLKISSPEGNMEDATLIKMRENSQYGTETAYDNPKMRGLLEETREFIRIVKAILQ